jgi:hypothetical protein
MAGIQARMQFRTPLTCLCRTPVAVRPVCYPAAAVRLAGALDRLDRYMLMLQARLLHASMRTARALSAGVPISSPSAAFILSNAPCLRNKSHYFSGAHLMFPQPLNNRCSGAYISSMLYV